MNLPRDPSFWTIFTAGLLTSLHCFGMCGPLGCSFIGGSHVSSSLFRRTGIYHLFRLISYSLWGILLGWLGELVSPWFSGGITRYLPWSMAVFFLGIGLGLDRKLPQPRWLSTAWSIFHQKISLKNSFSSPLLLGLLTPFLPCGPLYMALGVALFSGSALKGGTLMMIFATGTIPIYWLLQSQLFKIQSKVSPSTFQWIRQILALTSAALLVWRALASDGGGLTEPKCPMCHP